MINLLNKLLAKFNLQITSKQEEEPQKKYSLVSLVEETVKLLDTLPKDSLNYNPSYHEEVKVINYYEDKNGKTYYQDEEGKYFCDYDMKNPSQEVLGHMIAETTFTKEQLEDKLKNELV